MDCTSLEGFTAFSSKVTKRGGQEVATVFLPVLKETTHSKRLLKCSYTTGAVDYFWNYRSKAGFP
eukprot:7931852-Ditylum_brightwellii.AAC.1